MAKKMPSAFEKRIEAIKEARNPERKVEKNAAKKLPKGKMKGKC